MSDKIGAASSNRTQPAGVADKAFDPYRATYERDFRDLVVVNLNSVALTAASTVDSVPPKK